METGCKRGSEVRLDNDETGGHEIAGRHTLRYSFVSRLVLMVEIADTFLI